MEKLKYDYIELKKDNVCYNDILGIEVELAKIEDKKNKQYLKKIALKSMKNYIEVYAKKEEK